MVGLLVAASCRTDACKLSLHAAVVQSNIKQWRCASVASREHRAHFFPLSSQAVAHVNHDET